MTTEGHGQVEPSGPPPEDVENLASRVEVRLDELAGRFEKSDWIELFAALILASATIVAAWSAYQTTRWNGEQATAASGASALRTESAKTTAFLTAQLEVDAEMVTTWLTLAAQDNERGMAVIEERLSESLEPAFTAWLATAPDGEIPPGLPQDLPQYQENLGEALDLTLQYSEQANALSEEAREANQTGDNFVLVTVVMASVLFFAGVGTKFKRRGIRIGMLLMALALFTAGLVFLASMPQSVGI